MTPPGGRIGQHHDKDRFASRTSARRRRYAASALVTIRLFLHAGAPGRRERDGTEIFFPTASSNPRTDCFTGGHAEGTAHESESLHRHHRCRAFSLAIADLDGGLLVQTGLVTRVPPDLQIRVCRGFPADRRSPPATPRPTRSRRRRLISAAPPRSCARGNSQPGMTNWLLSTSLQKTSCPVSGDFSHKFSGVSRRRMLRIFADDVGEPV